MFMHEGYKYYFIKVFAYDNNINDVNILFNNDESNHNDFEKRYLKTIIIIIIIIIEENF